MKKKWLRRWKGKKAEEIPAAIKDHIDDTEGEGPPVFVRGLTEQIVKDGDKVILEVEISGKCLREYIDLACLVFIQRVI